jgi:polyhydroxyalkanoate synthase
VAVRAEVKAPTPPESHPAAATALAAAELPPARPATAPVTRPAAPAALPPKHPLDAAQAFDRSLHALYGRVGGGLSPITLALAAQDWAMHLATQPAQATHLAALAQSNMMEWLAACASASCAQPDATTHVVNHHALRDPRFTAPVWQSWPWAGWVHAHHQAETWWDQATQLRGMNRHHTDVVRAFARQWLDTLSPSNLPANPEVLKATQEQMGANLVRGMENALDDWREEHGLPRMTPPEHPYQPGVDLALTPGAVVYRNRLVELIQYSPTTDVVQAEPIFIVPSWIMKYYILDLSPQNSFVRWLVGQGHTVFILSWHNPDESDAAIELNDYLQWGIFDSLAAIRRIVPDQPVHACGYCLGGTLLAMAAAALARPQQVADAAEMAPLASVTLLAAETDFKEPGELGVFIDESQVHLLEAMMGERGYLTGKQMAGSFQFLHARDLVWSSRMRAYLLGERTDPNDLMAWNADTTRMPARMHSQYLHRLYLENQLAESRYEVEGRPVSMSDIRVPMFAVGTEKDHVSPWHSVYKLHRITETELTFVLTSGGHNAGIVSEPGHARRHYRQHTTGAADSWMAPDAWEQAAVRHDGSWWTAWDDWLKARSRGTVQPRTIPSEAVLEAAPGSYVHECYND